MVNEHIKSVLRNVSACAIDLTGVGELCSSSCGCNLARRRSRSPQQLVEIGSIPNMSEAERLVAAALLQFR